MRPEPDPGGGRRRPPNLTLVIGGRNPPDDTGLRVIVQLGNPVEAAEVVDQFSIRGFSATAIQGIEPLLDLLPALSLLAEDKRWKAVLVTDTYETVSEARALLDPEDLVIAFLIASDSEADMRSAIEKGADWVTAKPFDPVEFFGT